ncbi:MAG TPA: DUF2225 domain-containing protein [Candidatus Angelobacter sp.]|jgi:hypothetical protein
MKRALLIVLLLLLTSSQLQGVALARSTVVCPICGEKNEFFWIVSFGGYVYSYPPKYYRLGWGYGYPALLWVCNHCHYASWVWEFSKIKPDEAARVREMLKGQKFAGFNDYSQVPLRLRLSLAELCAKAAGKDAVFWSEFYRAEAYHLGRVGKTEEAKTARVKARDSLIRLSQDAKHASARKESLFAQATVEHFLGDDAAALSILAQAREEPLADSLANEYLNHDIDEYIMWIKRKAIPPDQSNGVPYPLIFGLTLDEKKTKD